MTLNSSGPISLGGSTSGQSINLELGQGASTQVSLNDANVRTLAGVASGQISMPANFWGKSTSTSVTVMLAGGGGPSATGGYAYGVGGGGGGRLLTSSAFAVGQQGHHDDGDDRKHHQQKPRLV